MRTAVASPDREPERRPATWTVYVPGGTMQAPFAPGVAWLGPVSIGSNATVTTWTFTGRT
jgi:hypothetical protein